MFRPKLAVWMLVALVAAWLASCSSDVDGYHLATEESGVSLASGGGGRREAGVGGEQAGTGAQSIGPNGGGGIGGGTGGGTGGRDLDARADGDSSFGGAGGAPAGGAGGGNTGGSNTGGAISGGAGGATGGAQNGGAGGGVTGGVKNGGAGGGVTGGSPNTGGNPTGGAPNTGGNPTGGAPNTGGTPTGGAPNTGGNPTGGAPNTGGATPTGGAPTGGTPNTGGSPTGGAPSTGGATGYPLDPTQETITGASLDNITAAAWEPTSRRFFLLEPAARQYWILSTSGAVTGPVGLQGTGTVAPNVFGVSQTDVFFVTGTMLYRQPISTGTTVSLSIPGSPAQGVLSGGYAGGWFFLGNASGACQALQDGTSAFGGGASSLSAVYKVATDAASFVFRTQGPSLTAVMSRITPGTFAVNGTPCNTGTFGTSSGNPNSVYGNNVGWVILFPLATTQYQLNMATVTNGVCANLAQTNFGNSTSGAQAVGVIDSQHALVTPLVTPTTATIDILHAGDQTFSRTPKTVNIGASGAFPTSFVVGAEATTHFAVLVTKKVPVLISF